MPIKYNTEAVETCRKFYCETGGNGTEIEKLMRKAGYVKWRKQNLIDRGGRHGWVTRFGFEKSLKIYTQKLVESVNDDEQDLYLGIREMRKAFQHKALVKGASKDEVYQYRDFCKLEIEARRNLDLSRDNLETFVSGYEKLINWLSDIDPKAAKGLIKHGDKLAALAEAHYGKEEENNSGAGVGANESGK